MAEQLRWDDGELVTAAGRRWRRTADWVEPDDAATFVQLGRWWVEWCEDQPAPGKERDLPYLLGKMVTRRKADRLMRKPTVPTVIVAEFWSDEAGDTRLLFVEQGPHPR